MGHHPRRTVWPPGSVATEIRCGDVVRLCLNRQVVLENGLAVPGEGSAGREKLTGALVCRDESLVTLKDLHGPPWKTVGVPLEYIQWMERVGTRKSCTHTEVSAGRESTGQESAGPPASTT
jgi:hypothetical protein